MKQKPKKQEELPDFPFPVFLENRQLHDVDLKHKLPLELFLKHEGYEVGVDGESYKLLVQVYSDIPKDSLKLKISSSRGRCLDAIHYYGELHLTDIYFKKYGTNRVCDWTSMPSLPNNVVLHRRLTEEEILENPDRWKGCQGGMMTESFRDIDDVVRRARFIAKKYFPGFKLITTNLK